MFNSSVYLQYSSHNKLNNTIKSFDDQEKGHIVYIQVYALTDTVFCQMPTDFNMLRYKLLFIG